MVRKNKAPKDPNAPKKPLSGYMRFVAEKRQEFATTHPDLKITEISSKAGELWKAMIDSEKDVYNAEYRKEKEVWDVAMEKYRKSQSFQDHLAAKDIHKQQVKAKEKYPKDPNSPKKAKTAYMIFAAEQRQNIMAQNPDVPQKEIMKKIGAKWSATSDTEKKPYLEKQALAKAEHIKQMEEYKASEGYKLWIAGKEAFAKEKKHQAKAKPDKYPKDPNTPKKAKTAYMIFASEHRQSIAAQNPDVPQKEIMKKIGAKWSSASDAEKKPYLEKQALAKAEHTKEVERYRASAGYKKWLEGKEAFEKEKKSAKKRKASPINKPASKRKKTIQ